MCGRCFPIDKEFLYHVRQEEKSQSTVARQPITRLKGLLKDNDDVFEAFHAALLERGWNHGALTVLADNAVSEDACDRLSSRLEFGANAPCGLGYDNISDVVREAMELAGYGTNTSPRTDVLASYFQPTEFWQREHDEAQPSARGPNRDDFLDGAATGGTAWDIHDERRSTYFDEFVQF